MIERIDDNEVKWERGPVIGKGSYSTVYLFSKENNKDNKQYAAKIVNKIFKDSRIKILAEIEIHKRLIHPNLIKLITTFQTGGHIINVTEYSSSGDLNEHLRKVKTLEEDDLKELFLQVISGLEYLHNLDMVHRDIKPANILLEYDLKRLTGNMEAFPYQVRICDFGFTMVIGSGKCICNLGSPIYQAPESILDVDSYYWRLSYTKDELLNSMMRSEAFLQYKKRCFALDVWSLGICIYLSIYGKLPFLAESKDKLFQKILNLNYSLPDREVSENMKELFKGIFVKTDRLSLLEVKSMLS